jgi:hypothetical protein
MFNEMPDDSSVMEMIKNSTPIDIEDPELKAAKDELARLKRLNFDQQIDVKFGALKLYMDLYIEWKTAQAQNRLVFSWKWGNLKFHYIEVFERNGKGFCPIMSFIEFSALLIVAYNN